MSTNYQYDKQYLWYDDAWQDKNGLADPLFQWLGRADSVSPVPTYSRPDGEPKSSPYYHGSDETIACIKDGSMWGSIVQDFYSMGYISVQYAVACLEGKEIPDMTDSGTFFVSAENVDSFQENVDAQKRLIEQNIPVA